MPSVAHPWKPAARPIRWPLRGQVGPESREAINLDPSFPTAYVYLGRSLWGSNRKAEAVEAFRNAVELYPGNAMMAPHLGYAIARSGATADAIRMLADLQAQSASSYVPATSMGLVELGLGHPSAALASGPTPYSAASWKSWESDADARVRLIDGASRL